MVIQLNDENKKTRIELRLIPAAKERVELAAQLCGRKTADFIQQAALDAANKAIEHHLLIELNLQDAERFTDVILNPRLPNEALTQAAQRYKAISKDK